jgi:hypothetical protein
MTPGDGSARLRPFLRELEDQLARAIEHERIMLEAVEEARGWSEAADREWIVAAATEAFNPRELAERRLEQGREICGEFTT